MSSRAPIFGQAPPKSGPVPSWMAPRNDRVGSRSPLRGASEPPRARLLSERAPTPSTSAPAILSLEAPEGMALRAPRTPSIPPPVHIECGDCAALRAEAETLAAERDALAAELRDVRRTTLLECEHDLVRLALAVAERVVGRELKSDPTLFATWAREAIDALAGSKEITVAVAADVEQVTRGADFGATVVVDTSLKDGTCAVHAEPGHATVSAEARIRAVAEALGANDE